MLSTPDFRQNASSALRFLFPKNLAEWLVFFTSLLAYGIFGNYIARNFTIIFDDRIPWDAYFSFDNRAIVMTGGGFERHPLANYFFDALRQFSLFFSDGKKDVAFREILAMVSAVAVSFSLLHIFKYLRDIVRLPPLPAVLLTTLFSVFTTPVLLSFTPETYTYTLLLLCIFFHFSAKMLRNDRKIPAWALLVGGVSVGGLTITNIVKVYIPVLFEKHIFRSGRNFANAALRVLLSAAAFVLLYLNRVDFDVSRIFSKTGEQYEKFSNPKATPLWDMVASWFWGGNMLFPSFVIRDYHNKKGFQYKALFMDTYSSWAPYAAVGLVAVLFFWGFFRNYKNRFAQILMLSFLVDALIHCVLKFGLHTSYIYGGHFTFLVPMMLGWLFHSYRDSPGALSALYVCVFMLMMFIGLNNICRLAEFFEFLNAFYR